MLEKRGREIVIFELQGPLFFGSAENLAREIENAMSDAAYCILDMKRVSEIDSTGAQILGKISTRMADAGKHVLITYLSDNSALSDLLEAMGIYRILQDDRHLSEFLTGVPLEHTDVFHDFTGSEMSLLRQGLEKRTYGKGENVIREGSTDRSLYILTRGAVSVKMSLLESDRQTSLVTYTSGVIFGEMAFLDGSPRSADVWVETDSEAFLLSPGEFEKLSAKSPEIAVKLVRNVALELSKRLRTTLNEARALEEG